MLPKYPIPTLRFKDEPAITNAYGKANLINRIFEGNFTAHSEKEVPLFRNRIPIDTVFCMPRVTVGGVRKLIDDLKTNCAPGPDGVSSHILKFTKD